MRIFRKALGFLQLYRADVFIRYSFLYLLGCYVAAGSSFEFAWNALVSLLLSGLSFNFIYSLNSWADADIDAINKPHRPIPAGVITKHEALTYILALLVLSVAYPPLLFGISWPALCFLWFPIAGILYSNPVFAFKKQKYLALLLITATVLWVGLLGYFLNGGVVNGVFLTLSVILVAGGIVAVPLKDIPDVAGDTVKGAENWFKGGVRYTRLFVAAILLVIALLYVTYKGDVVLVGIGVLSLAYFIALVLLVLRSAVDIKRFYAYLSWGVVIDAAFFLAWYALVYA